MAKPKIKVIDKGARARRDALRAPLSITVGIHEGEGSAQKGDSDLATVAAAHEFGLGNVPERSFVRAYVDENKNTLEVGILKRAAKAVTSGKMDRKKVASLVGEHITGQMKKRISAGIPPPLSEARLKQKMVGGKGGATPLIHTGQLRSSITYKVDDG